MISIIDGKTDKIIDTISFDTNPDHILVNENMNKVYVLHGSSNTISVISDSNTLLPPKPPQLEIVKHTSDTITVKTFQEIYNGNYPSSMWINVHLYEKGGSPDPHPLIQPWVAVTDFSNFEYVFTNLEPTGICIHAISYWDSVVHNNENNSLSSVPECIDVEGISDISPEILIENRGQYLTEAILTEAILTEAILTEAILTEAILTEAILTEAILTEAILTEAILTEAILTEAILTEAILTEAILTEAILTEAILTEAILTEAILTEAILTEAILTEAILTEAILTEAILTEAILTEAILTEAILTEAILTEAILTEAILTEAILTEAILTEAILTEAILTEAILTEAILPKLLQLT